jgi:hypothetical protein
MPTRLLTVSLAFALLLSTAPLAGATGLPISKYLEDPDHQSEVISFYLNAMLSGMTVVNERIRPKLYCVVADEMTGNAFDLLDERIRKLQAARRLPETMTVDELVLDVLMEEFPCPKN